jgi:hypothetical protein
MRFFTRTGFQVARSALANDLSRTAIGNPIAIVPEGHRSAAVEDCDPNRVEIKLTHVRH